MKEIWKDIEWAQGYQVSNLGKVKSLERPHKSHHGTTYIQKERILKTRLDPNGYEKVGILKKDGKQKQVMVHRLVAEAFIPNPDNLPQVNHKDENRSNNIVNNLEWCTAKYNQNYGHCRENHSKAMMGKKMPEEVKEKLRLINSKPVLQYDVYGNYIRIWDSVAQASRELGIDNESIRQACLGKFRHAGFYKWKYAS